MSGDQLTKISKTLSYVLRHRPDSIGLTLAEGGWLGVTELMTALQSQGTTLTLDLLNDIVEHNDKQRFEFNEDRTQIRARQGHSIEVDLQYSPAEPPPVLFHGTATRFLSSIRERGLLKMQRQHVHLSTDYDLMLQVGARHGKPIVLSIAADRMTASGHLFFITANQVWLTDHVPVQFLTIPGA